MNFHLIMLLFALLVYIAEVKGADILVMLPLPFYSHTNTYMPIFKELANRGHNITMVSPFPQKKPIPNFHDIVVENLYQNVTGTSMFELSNEKTVFDHINTFWDFGLRSSEVALSTEPVKRVIKGENTKFDLILTETFFLLEPMVALSQKYKCPIVNLHPWSMFPIVADFTGNHLPYSYVPNPFAVSTDQMTFGQRIKNTLSNIIMAVGTHFYYIKLQDRIMRKHFVGQGYENLPSLHELLYNTSLTLLDTHLALDYPKPFHKNVIEIGGLTLIDKEPLSMELKQHLDGSKDGFIYFSIGSHLKTDYIKKEIQSVFFSTFEKIKHNFIIKWDAETIPNQPNNIKLLKWAPQASILGHPNCKLFITHGGLHGIQEATYYGVPIVGVPMFADQPFNMKFVESIGTGLTLDMLNITEESLTRAINTVLTSPVFKKNADRRSRIMRDTEVPVLDRAIYWIEYVIRHNGAPHLKPGSLGVTWYQYLLIDVLLVILLIFILASTTLLAFLKICSLVFSKNKSKSKKKTA